MNQLEEFQQRLNRIKNREQYGLAQGYTEEKANRRTAGSKIAGAMVYPLSLILAAALGVVAVIAVRLAFFHLMDASPAEQITAKDIALTAGLGFAAAFVAAQWIGLSSKLQTLGLLAGLAVALTGFHNLFHWAPSPMASAFSPEYASGIIAMAGPNTAHLAGEVYAIPTPNFGLMETLAAWTAAPTAMAEAEPEKPIQPQILKLDHKN